MLICIQVAPMQETKTEKLIHAIVDREIKGEFFHIERLRLKKYRGEMRKVKDRIFPGYIFVDTDDFDEFYTELKRVPKLTSVVLAKAGWEPDLYGWTDFNQLSEEEERIIRSLAMGGKGAGNKQVSNSNTGTKDNTAGRKDSTAGEKNNNAGRNDSTADEHPGTLVIGLSQVAIEEGKQMVVISGPLKGNEGLIKKVDLHRREATIELTLMGRKMDVLLCIELKKKKKE